MSWCYDHEQDYDESCDWCDVNTKIKCLTTEKSEAILAFAEQVRTNVRLTAALELISTMDAGAVLHIAQQALSDTMTDEDGRLYTFGESTIEVDDPQGAFDRVPDK